MITAEKVYKDIIKMPVSEREKLFSTIARRGFEKDLYTHDEVFDDIRRYGKLGSDQGKTPPTMA
jgi:hypothetical protein